MGPWPDDAHIAEEHVPELRHLVDAEFAKPFPERINALIAVTGLPRFVAVIRAHRAELIDSESAVLHAGAGLDMKKRAGRLNPLRDPDNHGEDRENQEHDGQ